MKNINATSIKSAFPSAFRSVVQSYPNFGFGRISSESWWEKVILNTFNQVECNKEGVDMKQLSKRLFSKFSTKQGYSCFPETVEVLKHLKGQGITLGVISNSGLIVFVISSPR